MKTKILVFIILAIGVVWLWDPFSSNKQDAPRRTATVEETIEPAAPVPDESQPVYTDRERPQLPSLSAAGNQVKSEPVEFDRRPWDPDMGLTPMVYEGRVKAIAAFDRFREETKISEEKAQTILAILYDYQETKRHLRKQHLDRIPYPNKWEQIYKSKELKNIGIHLKYYADEALEELLTPEEMRAWNRTVEDAIWTYLTWPYEPRLIVPVDNDPFS